MNTVPELAAALATSVAATSAGDISTMAELLDRLETYGSGAREAELPNLHKAAEAIGEVVKRIIMDAVPDTGAAFDVVSRSITTLAAASVNGDLGSFAGFPPELNLGDAAEAEALPAAPGKVGELIDDEILAEFFDQNLSSLEEVESLALQLEQNRNPDALAAIRRYIHTIKGESGFIGFSDIETVCHATENYLESADPEHDVEMILAVIDWLRAVLGDLSTGRPGSRRPEEIVARLERAAAVTKAGQPSEGAPASATPAPPATPVAEAAPAAPEGYPDLKPPGDMWELHGDTSLLSDFVSESREHLEVAGKELLNLESDPANQEALNSVFRAFHTIKGIASFLELQEILHLAHDAENLLDLARKGALALSHGLLDIAFESLDMMGELIGKVKGALEGDGRMAPEEKLPALLQRIGDTAAGRAAAERAVEPTDQPLGSVLVESGVVTSQDVDQVLAEERAAPTGKKLGELLVEHRKANAKDVAEAIRRQKANGGSAPTHGAVDLRETIRVDYDRLENMVDTIGELVVAEAMIIQDDCILEIDSEALGKKLHNFRMISRKLQELGTAIRMVPIAGTFQKMARLVRDLSKKSGKNIVFHTVGEETELDRAYVDKIGDPLVHMIRNSVDHGIEAPEDRVRAGKQEQATVELRAYHEGGSIIIEIRDDGRGINKEAVRAKAIERGLISEEARLSDQELQHLIFHPGFSTAAKVTEVSGRGVGMDVVKRNIEELRGQIQITSEEGVGTSFRLVLPLTLALIDGMVVRVGRERYIFPVLSVVESFRAEGDILHTLLGKGEMISLRDRQLPFYRLSELFEVVDAREELEKALVVVVENEGREIALLVDDLIGLQQTVIKSLGTEFGKADGVAGGAIMADGRIGLILDVPGLFKVAGTAAQGMVELSAGAA